MNDVQVDLNALFNESNDNDSIELLKARLHWQGEIIHAIINNLPSSIFVKDANGRKILANEKNYKGAGFKSEAEVLGKTDFEIFPKHIAEKFWADDCKVLRNVEEIIDRVEQIIKL